MAEAPGAGAGAGAASGGSGPSPRGKSIHVLFIHGVGRHSRLSSLFRAFQSLRSYIQSPEAPLESEDPFQNWKLEDFDDGSNPVCLRLTQRPGSPGGTDVSEVYLYEVNYSAIAGVVRENHELDLTHLLVSLDLAINVARTRLAEVIAKPAPGDPPKADLQKHLELAVIAQQVSGALVAATVPVLGLPSLVLRNYLAPFVADFTRFFEDVATFALDRNGEAVISAHLQHTVESITKRLNRSQSGSSEEFVIVAHSLGTVVTHSFLVKNWFGAHLPDRLITLGAPIGLVCWLWRFLDFRALRFDPDPTARSDLPYFCWKPASSAGAGGSTFEWINVVNHLDPIATAFPMTDSFMAMPGPQIAARLQGGEVRQHFVKTGGLTSVGAAHTEYYDDKANFLTILGKRIGLIGSRRKDPSSRAPDAHWDEALWHLLLWQLILGFAGVVLITSYVYWISLRSGTPMPWLFVPLYCWPALTIGMLAFFQRWTKGGPTKRTLVATIEKLSTDRWTLPYLIPRWRPKFLREGNFKVDRKRPAPVAVVMGKIVSFVPTFVAMVLPIVWLQCVQGSSNGVVQFIKDAGFAKGLAFVALFMAYTVCFAGSEFARHWRRAIKAARSLP